MNSKIQHLLTSADNYVANARRYLDSGEAVNWVCNEMNSALMWGMEAWLLKHGYTPNFGNGWHSMRVQFYENSPDNLRLKVSDCLSELTSLQFHLDSDLDSNEGVHISMEQWKEKTYACLKEVEEFVRVIEKDILNDS